MSEIPPLPYLRARLRRRAVGSNRIEVRHDVHSGEVDKRASASSYNLFKIAMAAAGFDSLNPLITYRYTSR
jgi:hypothetical protein